ncbi:hypothetical protein GTY67_26240 [Streptomyces sp. SID8374]|uniref:phage tail protein n=1 Tax=Streptomyces sp. SID8374 TaxID=2690354 RepID=UPI00136EA8B8|nr:hypothetical protein [Streptomyces sp. SID8374]MYX16851.1 hypothetical protein [Streptomyces sp. SID8374]
MSDDPDLTGNIRLNLTPLINGLRFAQAVTRRQIRNMVRDANRSLNDLDTSGIRNRLSTMASGINLGPMVSGIGRAVGAAGRLAAPFAAAGAAVGSIVPLLAGVLSALAQIAPAAGLAATGVLAVGLAAGALKIGMMGVGDALKNAFDPESAEAYAESLKRLAPAARSFVETIRGLGPQFDKLKLRVQSNLFEGLGKSLKQTAKAAGPDLSLALTTSAGALNRMGRQVLNTATGLAKNGTLGKALDSATTGLYNLIPLPATIVQGLIQVGAAAGPAFERLTKRGGSALDRLSARMTRAFESGAMERAIERAIGLLGQLGRVIGNVVGIFGNLFKGVTASGEGLFSTLETITGSLREATGTDGFQRALRALSDTMRVVATTVGPLLGQALAVLGPVVEALAPPVQLLVTALGAGLGRVLTALGPVLSAAAGAVGDLVIALLPMVDVAADLIVATLPALLPLLSALSAIFVAAAPFVQQLASNLSAQLVPVLASLGPILQQALPSFVQLAETVLPQLTQILADAAPYLTQMAVQLAELAIAVAPVTFKILELATTVSGKLLPILGPSIVGIIMILAGALEAFAHVITGYVLPALRVLGALLKGDFSKAGQLAGQVFATLKADVTTAITTTVAGVLSAVGELVAALPARARSAAAGFLLGLVQMGTRAVAEVASLRSRIPGALGNLGGVLVGAGASLITGLISGIQSKIGAVRSKLGELTSMIPDWKGPKRKDATLLTPAGRSIIMGLIDGITATTPRLKSTLTSITNRIERAIEINKTNKKKVPGLAALLSRVEKDNKRLLSLAKARDKVAASLKTAQKKLDDIVSARAKKGADIQAGILGEANITTGFSLVNSVTAITVGLQVAVKKAQEFGANLAKLKKAGLRSDLLGDTADAGVDGGAATAAALSKATPAELKRINELQAQLAKTASKTGTTVAGALYDSGVKAAQGLVDGLKKQQKAIEKQMTAIANAMVKAIKKALKIKSPSRVFMGIGEMSGAGLREGMLRSRQAVASASASMARAAVGAADVASRAMSTIPAPGQLSAAYAGAGGDTTNNFYLQGGDATPDGILHALSWDALVGRRG